MKAYVFAHLRRAIPLFVCFISLTCTFHAEAETYYDQHAVGWHWYRDPIRHPRNPLPPIQTDPVQQMRVERETVERALDAAVLMPTRDNIKRYIVLQNQTSARASHFAKLWQVVLLQNPDLDYSIAHPTNQLAREVYLDQENSNEDAAIKKLAAHSGLFFFYRSTCPYCQRFAPILKDFSERYGITVVPITTDGIALPSFPHSHPDTGQSARFHVTVEPALFTVDPYSHQAVPVSYGLLSEGDLRKRILEIADHFQGDSK
jgi:conjugal transfer pilus assembly protein TraF